jgi:glycogen debranching enzyme
MTAGPETAPADSGVLNAGEPVTVGSGGETVTLVDAGTFFLSSRGGDVAPGGAHGLFFRDARVLSRWELRLDGRPAQLLSVHSEEAFTARFVLRRPPTPGRADSTLLVVRDRLVGDGLRETITVHNLGQETTAFTVTLKIAADFADLFAVKEGRAGRGAAEAEVIDGELVMRARSDPGRGVWISASQDPLLLPGGASWRVVVPARGQWTTEVVAEPMVGGRRVGPGFGRGEHSDHSWAARKLSAWRRDSTAIRADSPALNAVLRRTETDLGALQIHDPTDHRPFVAAGAPWFMTLFGRDSLLTAWMVLPLNVNLAVGTLRTLAAVQGGRVDPFTEEEPGRILHELRMGPDSHTVLGGSHYYGSVDATPLFVMLLAECWRWGADEKVVRALLPAADAALAWIDDYGDRDGDGFVEYLRATDRGLINQGWKDSFDGINYASGRSAEAPIALCEVQAYVYSAWLARAELADAFGQSATAEALRVRAQRLRERFNERFWLPGKGWYAVALDRDKRPVDALTSNTAHCLWAGIADDEQAAELVAHLSDEKMDTGYGLRTLSADMGAYNPISYHNGSVWPHDTAIAVAGLLRYAHVPGAVDLAHRLMTGLLDAADTFGGRLPELFGGFPRSQFAPPVPYPTSCSPQAWASAAPLLLVRAALGLDPHGPGRSLTLRPNLPRQWGTIELAGLRLGPATIDLTAHRDHVQVRNLPDGWVHRSGPQHRHAVTPARAAQVRRPRHDKQPDEPAPPQGP